MNTSNAQDLTLYNNTKIVFASVEIGQKILGKKDDFVSRLSGFDRSARLKTDQEISESKYLNFVKSNVQEWKAEEKTRLIKDIEDLSTDLEQYSLNMPDTIYFIKTTGKEEGGAPYTRQNAIVIPRNIFAKENVSHKKTILHELFHIWSRTNPGLRNDIYSIIGFHKCGEFELPRVLRDIKITNPDAPRNDYFIKLQYGDNEVKAVPILFSKSDKYDPEHGGQFFDYLVFSFLVIDEKEGGFSLKIVSNKPMILNLNEVSGYFDQIGRNTNYIIHPEEILADNFALMVQKSTEINSPKLIQTLDNFFQVTK